jgi:hypothetical protein
MDSRTDSSINATRAQLLDQLRVRLDAAEKLTAAVQRGLRDADASGIEEATARLETLLLEFRLLEQEYRRLPSTTRETDDPKLNRARTDLERAAVRIARSAAVGSGMLARLVAVSRSLIASMGPALGESYRPDGLPREMPFEGLRLKETV